jgi:hypothetical protein
MNHLTKILWRKPSLLGLLTCLLLLPLHIYSQNQWRVFTTQNSRLPDNNVLCIGIDSNNNKWIRNGYGLTKFNDTNWVVDNTTNSDLPSSIHTYTFNGSNLTSGVNIYRIEYLNFVEVRKMVLVK